MILFSLLIPIPLYIFCTYKRSLETVLQQIFFCLTISTSFYLAALSVHIEHFFNFESPEDALCKSVGFLNQYSGTVQLLYGLEIVMVLFYTIGKLPYKCPCNFDENSKKNCLLEACLYAIPWILPLPVASPFFLVPYGERGPWCWIQSRSEDCSTTGYWEQLALWYIPFGVAGVVSFLCVLLSLLGIFILRRYHQKEKLNKIIGEFLLLLVFLLGYCCLFAIELGHHRKTIDGDEYTICMMAYAISTPF